MDFKLTLCLCNILNTTTFLHWALCPYYDQALWSCQAIFPLRTNRTWTLYMAEEAARASCLFLSCWILPFCTQSRRKTYKLLDQRKLNSRMRESGKGLHCPFLCICPPWMQKVSYLVLWGKSQNFRNFGSAPASIHVLLSHFRCKLFPEMVLLRKSVTEMETEEEERVENQETEFKCWQELAKTVLSPDTLSKISVCTCAELGQLSPTTLAATDRNRVVRQAVLSSIFCLRSQDSVFRNIIHYNPRTQMESISTTLYFQNGKLKSTVNVKIMPIGF